MGAPILLLPSNQISGPMPVCDRERRMNASISANMLRDLAFCALSLPKSKVRDSDKKVHLAVALAKHYA